MSPRIKRRRGALTVDLQPREAEVVRVAFADLLALIDERTGGGPAETSDADATDPFAALGTLGPSEAPQDPVLARLFPDAYGEDAEASAEFRRFTEPDLAGAKRANIRTVLGGLDAALAGRQITLDPGGVQAWMYALNDLRLSLGTRLGVSEDYEALVASLDPQDPRIPAFALYEWLTGLQDAMVRAWD